MNPRRGIPRFARPGVKPGFPMNRSDFLDDPPRVKCAPAPGQNPEEIQQLSRAKDWPKAGTPIKVPQVVIISIMPDVSVYTPYPIDVRTNYRNSIWFYPPGFLQNIQSNLTVLPQAAYGIGGRSLNLGDAFFGFVDGTGQSTNFPELFDTTYKGSWPGQQVPVRYDYGQALNPEPNYYQQMLLVANAVKAQIEHDRSNLTYVQVVPWTPPVFTWDDSQYTEELPTLDLSPGGNLNLVAEGFVAFGIGSAGELAWGGWNDPFESFQLQTRPEVQNPVTPPQTPWAEGKLRSPFNLGYVNLDRSENKMQFNFAGPSELLFPNAVPTDIPFFGANVLHIYIGYRSFITGQRLGAHNVYQGTLGINETQNMMKGEFTGGVAGNVAAAGVVGMEALINNQTAGGHYVRAANARQFYRSHNTMVFSFPRNLGWSNTLTFKDPRQFEQFKYFYGATLEGGLAGPLWQPSFFNGGDPDYYITGSHVAEELIGIDLIGVPFWYPITERVPNNHFYTDTAVKWGSAQKSYMEYLAFVTAQMGLYYSDARTQYGDDFWRKSFDFYGSFFTNAGLSYQGDATGLDQTTLVNLIKNYFDHGPGA